MMMVRAAYFRALTCAAVLAAAAAIAGGPSLAQAPRPVPQAPARDTPAQRTDDTAKPPAGLIAGRVLASDSGRPVKRARVFVSAPELPGGRGILTDDSGRFEILELPAGRYTLTVSKSGFVSIAYGQRRPLQAGTPLQLADGQQIKDVDFRLPRGSVVAGHVYDETGDALPGVLVRVLRYQYQQGERRLTAAGTAQTDDLGQYRVWGLMPGDYYVDAQSRVNLPFAGGGRGRGAQAAVATLVGRLAGANVATLFAEDDENQKSYAPTYFPGVTALAEAQPVTLNLGQTAENIDFGLQLVRVARLSGRVTNPDGSPTSGGTVNLVPEAVVSGGGNRLGINYGSRINDGAFAISNVPPGRYTLRARGTDLDWAQYASEPVTVTGTDIDSISVVLAEGAVITGAISFPPTDATLPELNQVRIQSVPVETGASNSQARIEKDNTFKIVAVPAGAHFIRPTGQLRGWSLKSVILDGRDITDVPLELRSGQSVAGVVVSFTNQVNEITGTLTSDQGTPVTEYTVLAFSTDASFWRPQSRHIGTARPDQTGKFRIRGLPSGSYYVATVDPAEQGEWFEAAYLDEHRVGAARLTLGDGDTKTQDFRVRVQ